MGLVVSAWASLAKAETVRKNELRPVVKPTTGKARLRAKPLSVKAQTDTSGFLPSTDLSVKPFSVQAHTGTSTLAPATGLSVRPYDVQLSTGNWLGLPETSVSVKPFDLRLSVGGYTLRLP
jgi:hypothetical protein